MATKAKAAAKPEAKPAKAAKPAPAGKLKDLSPEEQASFEKSKANAAAVNAKADAAKAEKAKPEAKPAAKAEKAKPVPPKADPEAKAKKEEAFKATRYFATVSEDTEGVKMQDASKRTAVFRAIAKGGKKGETIANVMAATSQDITSVRGAIRVLEVQERVSTTKPE